MKIFEQIPTPFGGKNVKKGKSEHIKRGRSLCLYGNNRNYARNKYYNPASCVVNLKRSGRQS